MPPNLAPFTVEKVAINAVMAGCKPEYMPVVLAALEAALEPEATMHGLLCTTCFSGPIIVVNGPIARAIGMNSGINCLGQGNRANATIGRALQLIIRNVGGGRPGELDRAVLGGPGKYTFCFAEDESDPTWMPLSVARGIAPGKNAVTLFQGDGIQGFIDQRSRTPEQLTKSLALSLLAVGNWKLCEFTNAMLVLVPEHYAIYREAGWNRDRITRELHAALLRSGKDVVKGALGVGEGIDVKREGRDGPQVLARGPADRARRRRGRSILGDLRRLDRRPLPRRVEARNEGDPAVKPGLMMRDPTAETASDLRARTAPLTGFAGKTIALMDIGKMRGDEFIDRLEQLCRARGVATRRYKKPTNTRVAPREMIRTSPRNARPSSSRSRTAARARPARPTISTISTRRGCPA